MPLSGFDPLIVEWFERRFGRPTEPQVLGWPEIRSGRDVLICAPTGSGKTLAAFLLCLDELVRTARSGELPDQTTTVYVSPLKALSNDIHRNLEAPLAEIYALAQEKGLKLAPIRTAVRTGDTSTWERQQMMERPPHILVTTPESLFILLTARRGREMLQTARTLIVDEIHAVADDKRGSHLALSIARFEALVQSPAGDAVGDASLNPPRRLQRIGLSATVKPIGEVAQFLSSRFAAGGEGGRVIEVGHHRPMDLAVEVPQDELSAVASNEMWAEIHDRLAALIAQHSTTLIFVNTRRLAERLTHHLQERLGEGEVLAHHGSLSRRLRFLAEQRLKNGELRAVVATASLELGIDIGTVDLVCQIGSPRSIAVARQRCGRAGHWVGATPKARLFVTTRDELIECAALVRAIHRGELDRLEIPEAPLDILAQQIVAEIACRELGEDELWELVRSTYPYRNLTPNDFEAVLGTLSEGISTSRGRSGAYLHRDQVNHRLRARRGARLAAITSGGAIPDTAQYQVVAEPEGVVVGSVDEDFAVESMAGDVFLLGTTSWRIRRVEPGRVRVEDAHGAAPSIPFWRGEAPGRTFELSEAVSQLRVDIDGWSSGQGGLAPPGEPALPAFLAEDCGLDRRGAEQALAYVRAGRAALGVLPTQQTVVAERFFDEAGGMQLILHAPFGSRINRAWGLSLRKRFCRSFNLELQASATDNGINISLTEQHAFPLELVFQFLAPETLEHVLRQALLASPMFTVRWRWNASRALAVLRFAGGRKVPPPIQRMRAEDLLAATFPDQAACAENLTGEIRIPDHPLVNETINNCLYEAMDLKGLRAVILRIQRGEIRAVARETAEPSPFSHEILNANPYAFLDDAPLEERRARAVQMRQTLGSEMADGHAALDAAAIAQVEEECWPLVRDADELHDALLTLITVPPVPEWADFFEELVRARRAAALKTGESEFWVAAERLELAQKVHPGIPWEPPVEPVLRAGPVPESREGCAAEILRGWLDSTGPATASDLAQRLALSTSLTEIALTQLESEGQVLRGRFSPAPSEDVGETAFSETDEEIAASQPEAPREIEWCNRRVLARIHRLTLRRLRAEIEPVTTQHFMRYLCRWQHTAPGSRLYGVDGTLQVIKQLQGFEIPSAAWESEILPRRVADYEPEFLDRLCLAGEVMWGRLSPHPAFEDRSTPAAGNGAFRASEGAPLEDDPEGSRGRHRRVRPTRVAPIAMFLREDAGVLLREAASESSIGRPEKAPPEAIGQQVRASLSHPAADVLTALESRGASFFGDLVRSSKRLPSEVEDALWELVAAGLVTADGFENLRSLLDPKRRRGEGRGRTARPRHAAGRWALLAEAVHREPADGGSDGAGGVTARVGDDPVAASARQLLARWGVVFRDLVKRETLAPAWRDVLTVLRRMEARGEVRGGRFVTAFGGEQFALPEALELLRAVRRHEPSGEEIRIHPADPLNLVGIVLPGPRVNSLSGEAITLRDGVVVEERSPSILELVGQGPGEYGE